MLLAKALCAATLFVGGVHAVLTNYTLDDTSPNITYTREPLFRCSPGVCNSAWTARLFNQTSATTDAPITVPFTGSAVYVYLETLATCYFKIDGVLVGGYVNASDQVDINLAYWTVGLPDSQHVLTIYPAVTGSSIQFDYIIYSHDVPQKKSHVAAIIGGVVGGVALTVILSLAAFIVRRREKKRRISMRGIPLGDHWPDKPSLKLAGLSPQK
ncbi:hypothetical protein B0H15DRAFT_64903 [Mycena belliarum]|uniref:Uncharacterized protein n=1 Tax=Mycena belliarum TaxID=1033014 RepID=A0AAD6TR56_9AGAR|nr:hypothetical protein B0H15DRAFT_64903 [Mycena belliae]